VPGLACSADAVAFGSSSQPWLNLSILIACTGMILALIGWYRANRRRVRVEAEKEKLQELVGERAQELAEKQSQLEKRRDQLSRINTIVKAINAQHIFQDLLDSLLEHMPIVKGEEKAAALIWDKGARAFQYMAARGWQLQDLASRSMSAEEAEARYVVGAEEVHDDIFVAKGTRPDESALDPWSMLTLRIKIDERIEGYLIFDRFADERGFAEHDLMILRDLKIHIISAFIKTRMLQELVALNENKNRFLGVAAHDLRNPLGVIIAWSEIVIRQLKSGRFSPEQAMQHLERVVSEAERMNRLVNDLLDISAIEAGKLNLELSKLQVEVILSDIKQLYSQIAAEKGIELAVEDATELPDVLADRDRIVEVIENLISNAVKFTEPGGKVRVYCKRDGDDVVVNVADSGPGLTSDDLRVVFKRYGRLSARPTAGEPSTGLGLAIVNKIVRQHGGQTWVESEKGKGATFSFSLPMAEANPPNQP
jgi:signal transduction histidine kinase